MADQGGKNKKLGRNKAKCERYSRNNTRAKNKIGQILRSCGRVFARAWAGEFGNGVRVPDRLPR